MRIASNMQVRFIVSPLDFSDWRNASEKRILDLAFRCVLQTDATVHRVLRS